MWNNINQLKLMRWNANIVSNNKGELEYLPHVKKIKSFAFKKLNWKDLYI